MVARFMQKEIGFFLLQLIELATQVVGSRVETLTDTFVSGQKWNGRQGE
jgi:hypothetical protein